MTNNQNKYFRYKIDNSITKLTNSSEVDRLRVMARDTSFALHFQIVLFQKIYFTCFEVMKLSAKEHSSLCPEQTICQI